MPRFIAIKTGLGSILFWSVISAAFIGPGTVTTAAAAGAAFKTDLLWALAFSTLACILLQEASARITIASGYSLGESIALKFNSPWLKRLLAFAVIFGCAAFQTGNILGAIAGISLLFSINSQLLAVIIALTCGFILWMGNQHMVSRILGVIVAFMGIIFIAVAAQVDIPFMEIASSTVIPSFPDGSGLLIIGLIGTTIVPYNLFLASGISKGQKLKEMQFGLSIAVLIGGIISMAVLLAGTEAGLPFSFESLANAMAAKTGNLSHHLFGLGLFAAGFTSAITAPLASAVTAKSIFGDKEEQWQTSSWRYRLVWGGVLLAGLFFGLTEVKPIPAILLAQAINGFLLPFVAVFLLLVVNDVAIVPARYLNNKIVNGLMLLVVFITSLIGLNNLSKAIVSFLDTTFYYPKLIIILALGITIMTGGLIYKERKTNKSQNS